MINRASNKLIVFDWNGTLLCDTRQSVEAGNVCLEFYGAQAISLKHYRDTFTFPILHFYKKNGLSVDEVLAKKDEANEVFQSAYERLAANARTRKGARALLNWVKDQKMPCIILSNYRTEKIKEHLARLKLEPYFDYVSAHECDGTTILHSTTKAERLKTYMDKHGYSPKDTIIIGDSTEEPEIARLLGLTSIGITDGYITEKRLREAKPDYVVHSLCKVKKILER